jgi:hypothetical protein
MEVPVSYQRQYGDTINLLHQQMTGVLSDTVYRDTDFTGEAKYQDQIASLSMTQKTARFQPTVVSNTDQRRRKITPLYHTLAVLKDPQDALATKVDPGSAFMRSMMAAAARQEDDNIISMFGSTAYELTAAQADSAVTLAGYVGYTGSAGSQIIAVGSNEGMSKSKLLTARKILNKGFAPMENRFVAHTSDQELDLLNTTEVVNSDYNVVKALVSGDVKAWLGFNFRVTERLLKSSTTRYCYAYQKDALWLGVQQNPQSRIDTRVDLSMSVQYYMSMCQGGARLQESGVVQLACYEAA